MKSINNNTNSNDNNSKASESVLYIIAGAVVVAVGASASYYEENCSVGERVEWEFQLHNLNMHTMKYTCYFRVVVVTFIFTIISIIKPYFSVKICKKNWFFTINNLHLITASFTHFYHSFNAVLYKFFCFLFIRIQNTFFI